MDASTPSCALLSIPMEVLLRIADDLTTPELGSLRLTCKPIENMLFNSFAEEFFSRKQFMFTESSLQALVDISKSRLGQFVRRLQFGIEKPTSYGAYMSDYIQNMCLAHLEFWAEQKPVYLVAEALRHLPNLEDVVIRDLDSNKRTRDGENRAWRSYGRPTEEGKGVLFTTRGEIGSDGLSDNGIPAPRALKTILHAFGLADKCPKGIEMISRRASHMSDSSFKIKEELQPVIVPVLERLEKLHLCVALFDRVDGDDSHHSAYFLCKFLSYTKNLKDLRINGDRNERTGLNRLLAHLGDPTLPLDKDTEQGLSLPKLEEFSLGMALLQHSDLIATVGKLSPSLRSLELWKLLIQRDDKLDDHVSEDDEPLRPRWARVCKGFSQIPEFSPRHIKLGYLQDQYACGSRRNVKFGDGATELTYTGPDCKRYLQDVIPKMYSDKTPARIVHQPVYQPGMRTTPIFETGLTNMTDDNTDDTIDPEDIDEEDSNSDDDDEDE